MDMYTIKEVDTDNYVSEMSFGKYDIKGSKWSYSTYTGRCGGMRYYSSLESASDMITKLIIKANLLGMDKQYSSVVVHINQLPIGRPIRYIVQNA